MLQIALLVPGARPVHPYPYSSVSDAPARSFGFGTRAFQLRDNTGTRPKERAFSFSLYGRRGPRSERARSRNVTHGGALGKGPIGRRKSTAGGLRALTISATSSRRAA